MNEHEMWEKYTKINSTDKKYNSWCFGSDMADTLADYVYQGKKTATTSAHVLYEIDKCPLPYVGELNIIVNTNGEALCITQTTKVYTCKFCDVKSSHALKEGEGDLSLDFWKKIHKEFFEKEFLEYGLEFNENIKVVCEEFCVVFK